MTNVEDSSCKTGTLHLVDLAGSEKIAKTGAAGQTLEEAKNINKSLSCLGKVIVALTDKKQSHIPYRESKLTRILSESLGGNSKTCLIITCSPHPFNDQETLSTLRFGARARNIKNTPKVNREYTVPELKKLLGKAEEKIQYCEKKIKVYADTISGLGGQAPNEKDVKDRVKQLDLEKQASLKESVLTSKESKASTMSQGIDFGDYDLMDMNFDLPDRSFTLMDKQNKERQIEEIKKAQINEKYEAELKIKQEEIERLTELLFGFKT